MAHIVGEQKQSTRRVPSTHLFLLIVVAMALIGFMLHPADSWRDNILSMLGTVVVILVIVGFALNKVDPMAWKQIFQRQEYERLVRADRSIFDQLQSLNNHYFILHDFNFELLHVDFLVLGPQGIFVISKTTSPEKLRVEDKILMAGTVSLQKQTGSLWRICHLVSMVIKKGYDIDIMPKPILVAADAHEVAVTEYDGISIVTPDSLVEEMSKHTDETMPLEQVHGFAAYLEKRYFR